MNNMEMLSNKIANIVSQELKLDKDNQEVIAYGTFAILQIIISIILVVIFGLIFNVTVESLIICLTTSVLRKYSGGAHSSSPYICTIIGTVICTAEAMIISFLIAPLVIPHIVIFLGIITFSVSYYLVFKLAPVDSPAKPIKTKKKIDRMKKGSNIVLSLYLLIFILNYFISLFFKESRFIVYSLCIFGGVSWQIFTLTKPGHFTLKKIDAFFYKILPLNEGRD